MVLDAECEKADQNKVMKNKCQHLTETQRNELLKLFQKYGELFHGTFGTCKTYSVDSKLKEDMNPICSITYTVPKVH